MRTQSTGIGVTQGLGKTSTSRVFLTLRVGFVWNTEMGVWGNGVVPVQGSGWNRRDEKRINPPISTFASAMMRQGNEKRSF